jgi:branched-subunit amino acid transport protein AzlD
MVILVAYALVSVTSTARNLRPLGHRDRAGGAATLHLWRRDFVLNILAGTGTHVLLASTLLGA